MATSLAWHPLFIHRPNPHRHHHHPTLAFRRRDLDGFARRVTSGDALRDAWRTANNNIETLAFEAKRVAQRLDREYSLSNRFDSARRAALDRARELDQELGIARQWRSFSVDFSRNWPRYRKELSDFMETPLGKSLGLIFFAWFMLSGWWFNFLVISLWVLPLASPLLIGLVRTFANNFVIEGACPACKKRFMGYRNQAVCCTGCRNVVWQPREDFSRDKGGRSPKDSNSDIIDIDI